MKTAAVLATVFFMSVTSQAAVEIMSYWRNDLDAGATDQNEFAVQWIVLDLEESVDNVGGRLALEFTTPNFAGLTLPYLRYAYGSVAGRTSGVELRIGLVPTSYVTWSDARAWPFVFVSPGFAELEQVVPFSPQVEYPCDLGVALSVDLGQYLRGLNATVTVTNGEGWTAVENDLHKAYGIALEYTPDVGSLEGFSGLFFYRTGLGEPPAGSVENRLGLGAAYEYGHTFGASAQYMYCEDGVAPGTSDGWSVAVWWSLVEDRKLMLLFRYDDFDPDRTTADDRHNRLIGGLGGEVGKFSWSIDFQTVGAQAFSAAPEDASIYVHTLIRF